MDKQIEFDKAAAKMLGHKHVSLHPDGSGSCAYRVNKFIWKKFTLTNPADLLAAMECLMREHGWMFDGEKETVCATSRDGIELDADTLPELIGLACMEVMNG